MSATFLYVTTPTREEGLRIGRTLVEERLAACANVIGGMTSLYWWEGHLQEDAETVLVLKTRADLAEETTKRVKELHAYTCPCIVAIPITGGNPEFLAWIERETRSSLAA